MNKKFDDHGYMKYGDDDGFSQRYDPMAVRSATKKSDQLEYPSYRDDRFRKMQALYGQEEAGLEYNYDDRLMQWDYEAHKRGVEAIEKGNWTAAKVEKYLTAYFQKPVEIRYVGGMANLSSGHPVYVYGYKFKEDK